jgi:hypothetical protein
MQMIKRIRLIHTAIEIGRQTGLISFGQINEIASLSPELSLGISNN